MKKSKKKFNCMKFKRQAREEIYEDIKQMSWEQQVEYFRKSSEVGPFAQWWKKVKQAQAKRKESFIEV